MAGDARTVRWATAAATTILVVAAAALLLVELSGREANPAWPVTASDEAGSRPVEAGPVARSTVERAPPLVNPDRELVVLPGPPPVPVDVRARVAEEATEAVASVREEVLATCRPALSELDGPASFTLHLSFDAAGKEVARGASSDSPVPAALQTCVLLAAAGTLRVDNAGTPMSVQVRLELP